MCRKVMGDGKNSSLDDEDWIFIDFDEKDMYNYFIQRLTDWK